jgi:hypothetical protein
MSSRHVRRSTKSRLCLFAVGLVLSATAAFAQSAPANLPFHSVYGRLGAKPGDTGPGQAIPFANLLAGLNGVAWGGAARMVPHIGQTTTPSDCYTLTDPYGNPIACTTSTTTQGLQEFLNATTSNGWPAVVYCQGTEFPSKTEPVFINTSGSVTVPVAQDWSFHSYGCNLNINVTSPATSGLIVDSEGASVFDWDGKIVFHSPAGSSGGTPTCAVLIKPTTNTADGFPGLYAKYFRVASPVVVPASGEVTAPVCIDNSSGSVIQQTLWFDELNANNGGAYYGLRQIGNSSTTGLQQNYIHIGQVHGFTIAGVSLVGSTTNQGNTKANIWDIAACNGANSAAVCVDSWGTADQFRIGQGDGAEGGLQYLVNFESGAPSNQVTYGNTTASSGPYLDSGNCNSITGRQGSKISVWGTTGCLAVTAPAGANGTTILQSGTMAAFPTDATTGNILMSPSSAVNWSGATFPSDVTAAGQILNSTGAHAWAATNAPSLINNLSANTSGDGISLQNNTAATSGNQSFSPRFHWTGHGWETSTSASQTVDWTAELRPVQGTTNPSANLVFSSQINGGGYIGQHGLMSSGQMWVGAPAVQWYDGYIAGTPMNVFVGNGNIGDINIVRYNGPGNSGAAFIGSMSNDT